MRDRGIVTAAALWLTLVFCSFGFLTISLARSSGKSALQRMDDAQILYSANSALVRAVADTFSKAEYREPMVRGEMIATVRTDPDGDAAQLRCEFRGGQEMRVATIDVRKMGGQWRVHSWSER
jgi:hypothetical protein